MELLLDTARTLDTDVIVSKPEFRKPTGEVVKTEWPIDDIVRTLSIQTARRLHPLEALVFAGAHADGALTGSCASDLFRTAVLKRFPFPTEYGTAGDGIWSVQHAAEVAWAVVPGSFSTFLLHPTASSQAENRRRPDAARPDAVLSEAVRRWLREGVLSDLDLERINWDELQSALTGYLDAKEAFDGCRKGATPWILNPRAWQARGRREKCLARLHEVKEDALRIVGQMASGSGAAMVGRKA
jgi:hypothetical protein